MTIQLHSLSHVSKIRLKILQVRLQQYANQELPDVQAGFRNTEEPEIKFSTFVAHRKSKGIPKSTYLCFIEYIKAFDCVDHNKLWKILQEMGVPDHLTCLLRNLHIGQEATFGSGHGTTVWFQSGKGVCKGYILSSCLFNLHAEYIMRNARLDYSQAGIKIAGSNINNLRYAVDTTLMVESEEKLKHLLMKVKEECKSWLKTQHLKKEDHSIWFHHFMANR